MSPRQPVGPKREPVSPERPKRTPIVGDDPWTPLAAKLLHESWSPESAEEVHAAPGAVSGNGHPPRETVPTPAPARTPRTPVLDEPVVEAPAPRPKRVPVADPEKIFDLLSATQDIVVFFENVKLLDEGVARERVFDKAVKLTALIDRDHERANWTALLRQLYPSAIPGAIRKAVGEKREVLARHSLLTPDDAGEGDPWSHIETVGDFLSREIPEVDVLEPGMLARGVLTEIFAPRGVGKTQYAHMLAVRLAKRGLRVLIADRDNPTSILKQRLEGWGAGKTDSDADLPTLRIIGREHVPSLFNADGWALFPADAYDVVIMDALDSTAEGMGERDSAKPGRALSPLLDLAHKSNGPAVLVLGNTVRTAEHSRGSGVVEDRADVVYEVRDMTGFTPKGDKPWVEEMQAIPAGAAAWAKRAKTRKGAKKYRLGFCATKYRIGVEPEPFVLEVDHTTSPWTIRDVTPQIEQHGQQEHERHEEKMGLALAAFIAQIGARERRGNPLTKTEAEDFLNQPPTYFGRNEARAFIEQGVGMHWWIKSSQGQTGRAKTLHTMTIPHAGEYRDEAPSEGREG